MNIDAIATATEPVVNNLVSSAFPLPSLAHTAGCAAQHFAPWMIEESWFRQAVEAVKAGTLQPKEASVPGGPEDAPYAVHNGVAIIPIVGAIMKKASKYGGTSSVATRVLIRKAANDDSIHSILLHVDSPGGTVAGTADLADDVRNANTVKPVYAYIEDLGASAAYWVASQARAIAANSTGEVGSIGTLLVLYDTSGQYAADGVKVHVISTGKYKGAAADGAPITNEQIQMFQQEVDDLNEHFIAGVASGRGMKPEAVRAVADGRVHIASKAQSLGLIDTVCSLQDFMGAILKNELQRLEGINPASHVQQNIAPEASRESETPPAVHTETTTMAETTATVQPSAPAQIPAAVTPAVTQGPLGTFATVQEAIANFNSVKGPQFFEEGRKKGNEEAATAFANRVKSIVDACPGKPEMALNAILTNQSADAVGLAYNATMKAEETARKDAEAKDLTILRLESLLAVGGHQGGVNMGVNPGADPITSRRDPKAQAEWEWENQPLVRNTARNKEVYVLARAAELDGTHRSFSREPVNA